MGAIISWRYIQLTGLQNNCRIIVAKSISFLYFIKELFITDLANACVGQLLKECQELPPVEMLFIILVY